ncbi:MAG: carbohydrate kinase family protein [Christensenellales bacterium]
MKKVLSVGTVVYDVPISPVGLDFMDHRQVAIRSVRSATGGGGLSGAVSLSQLGHDVSLVGIVGNDAPGDAVLQRLTSMGVNTCYIIRREDLYTAYSVVLVDPTGERHIVHYPGGNIHFTGDLVTDDMFEEADHFHRTNLGGMPLIDGEEAVRLMRRAKAHGCTTSMDVIKFSGDGAPIDRLIPILPYCDIFMPSDYEAEQYTGLSDPLEMKAFFRPYGLKIFGVKLGAKGIFVTDFHDDVFLPPMLRGNPVDTTGAGDSAIAGFVAGYLDGWSLHDCAALAMANAAQIVGALGANMGAKPKSEVLKYAETFGYHLPRE